MNFMGENKAKLVHGMVNGQGSLKGIRFGHAWVEYGSKILDHSNGKKQELPKKLYYAMGDINPRECKYYTGTKAAKWMLKSKHWGPWQMSGNPIKLQNEDIPDTKGELGKKKIRIQNIDLDKIFMKGRKKKRTTDEGMMVKLKDVLLEGRMLSVFDFDDTLAKSDSWIYVTIDGKEVDKLDPGEFAVYKPKDGEEFDFRDFDRAIQNPKIIKRNVDLLRKQLKKGGRKVTILTARRLGAPINQFFKTIGIHPYVVALGSNDPQKKADWIEAEILKGYDPIYFMDDSSKNIKAVNKLKKKYPDVKLVTKLVK